MKTVSTPIKNSRRHFFRRFIAETISLAEEICGRPQCRLSDVNQLPDSIIRTIVPVYKRTIDYRIQRNRLLLKDIKTSSYITLCHLSAQDCFIMQCINTGKTLDQIAELVENEFGEDSQKAYLKVKSLFLKLVSHAICHPANATPPITDT
jgi:hypothetical protein